MMNRTYRLGQPVTVTVEATVVGFNYPPPGQPRLYWLLLANGHTLVVDGGQVEALPPGGLNFYPRPTAALARKRQNLKAVTEKGG